MSHLPTCSRQEREIVIRSDTATFLANTKCASTRDAVEHAGDKQPLQEEGNMGERNGVMDTWRPDGPAFQATGHEAMLEAQQQRRLKAVKVGGTAAQVLSEPF